MDINWWAITVTIALWFSFFAIQIVRYRKKKKIEAELERKEKERKEEEELELARKEDAKREHQNKVGTVNYWLNKIGQCYSEYYLTDVIVKEIFDEDPFSTKEYYPVCGWSWERRIKELSYRGNVYKVFIPFKAIDGWIYAMTVRSNRVSVNDKPTEEIYIVELLTLGNEQTNFSIGAPANLPTLTYPEYMMADWEINNFRLKDNFEYFVPYEFNICEDIENPWKPTAPEGVDINHMVNKMVKAIENFSKSLKGEDE